MISINVQNLTYRFDNGDTLFSDLNFTLSGKVTGLVGRNGVGKSLLAALLAGYSRPYSGSISQFCGVGFLRQVALDDLFSQQGSISDFLGVSAILAAIMRVEQGGYDPDDFDLIGDNWLLREKIVQQLTSLGIPANPGLSCTSLSGGQLTRLVLHKLFQSDYGYLILDEPGNHLDEKGKAWLMSEIRRYDGGVLIISHDREILRNVDEILALSTLGLRHYSGNYEVYAEQLENERASHERSIERTKKQSNQLRRTVGKNREKALQRAGKGKKLARSGSQAKVLLNNKKQWAESARGARENHQNRRLSEIEDQLNHLNKEHEKLKPQSFTLRGADKRVSRILDITGVRLPYIMKEDDITLYVDFGDKIHVSGANGCGKSTLLKAVSGQLQPIYGEIHVHGAVCYLDQYFTLLDNDASALENLATFCPHLSETSQRTLLAGIGLRLDRVNQGVGTLSGGEKMKVSMLAISHQASSTLLLLDEPDNHLDMESRIMLAQALRDFSGSLLIVSHDQDFIRDIGVSGKLCLNKSVY